MLISNVKHNQLKLMENSNESKADSVTIKDQLARVEKILGGIKDKIADSNDIAASDVLCINGHKLTYEYLFDQIMACNKCNKNSEVGYHCAPCNYSLCKVCYKSVYKQKLAKSDVTCYRFHQLAWISDHSKYQNYDNKVFICVGCKKKLYQDSFNCKKCKWDICFKCTEILCTKISAAWIKSCNKNHPLEWNPRPHSESFKCNICIQLFQRSGSFRCDICDYDICIRCFDDLV